ncbi:glycosyl hydrolase family 17 protein [Spongiivirga sp. MCCC 1A20706]|uniref:glycosyl hydrolase family 17 protein n=1 Tax=Spongiivirga sp. MCCC 1A20706 TaxID=3160963 RepID=UPI0039777000
MKNNLRILGCAVLLLLVFSCKNNSKSKEKQATVKKENTITAKDILGNPKYQAISYGGYRDKDHNIEPTIDELKEDMKILSAMGVKMLRTYKLHKPHAHNLVRAISELKQVDPNFEMYIMLGAWIDCKNAWTGLPVDHNQESERNAQEIEKAVTLANQHPDIIKVIAVGNEAMVKWATSYYVEPWVILKWVNHLQKLKGEGKLSNDLWITSSDNFASWGGGGSEYHVEDLNKLIKAVDFLSVHTYPMHDTHYNPQFWGVLREESSLSDIDKIEKVMERSLAYAKAQYESVKQYMNELGVDKPIHIGETGWASFSNGFYGNEGSKATDEYKEALYYKSMRDWTNENQISCFYFEAFNEPWKDAANQGGSENHFGLFTVDGKAKYAVWDLVDKGTFEGLTRGGKSISKTYDGEKDSLMLRVLIPAIKDTLQVDFPKKQIKQ